MTFCGTCFNLLLQCLTLLFLLKKNLHSLRSPIRHQDSQQPRALRKIDRSFQIQEALPCGQIPGDKRLIGLVWHSSHKYSGSSACSARSGTGDVGGTTDIHAGLYVALEFRAGPDVAPTAGKLHPPRIALHGGRRRGLIVVEAIWIPALYGVVRSDTAGPVLDAVYIDKMTSGRVSHWRRCHRSPHHPGSSRPRPDPAPGRYRPRQRRIVGLVIVSLVVVYPIVVNRASPG